MYISIAIRLDGTCFRAEILPFSSLRFLALGRDGGWSIDSLQDTMRVACELIRPDQAVLSHLQLAKILEQSPEDGMAEVSEVPHCTMFMFYIIEFPMLVILFQV